jgi:hypothetical protein
VNAGKVAGGGWIRKGQRQTHEARVASCSSKGGGEGSVEDGDGENGEGGSEGGREGGGEGCGNSCGEGSGWGAAKAARSSNGCVPAFHIHGCDFSYELYLLK